MKLFKKTGISLGNCQIANIKTQRITDNGNLASFSLGNLDFLIKRLSSTHPGSEFKMLGIQCLNRQISSFPEIPTAIETPHRLGRLEVGGEQDLLWSCLPCDVYFHKRREEAVFETILLFHFPNSGHLEDQGTTPVMLNQVSK
jgi:hypothetical protein